MSKKTIGPSLPPHLQHLIGSTSEEHQNDHSDGSQLPEAQSNTCSPNKPLEEDDDILVLCVSEDEALVSSSDRPKPRAAKRVSRSYSNSSDNEASFGPALPPGFKQASKVPLPDSSDDEATFEPAAPPSFKQASKVPPPGLSDDDLSFGPPLPSSFKQGSSGDEDSFGPLLPPNFQSTYLSNTCQSRTKSSDVKNSYGPSSTPNLIQGSNSSEPKLSDYEVSFGPSLPPNFKQDLDIPRPNSPDDSATFGPAPPPGLLLSSTKMKVIGPALPPGLQTTSSMDVDSNSETEGDVVGPMPPGDNLDTDQSYIQKQLEARAMKMKRKLAGEDDDATPLVQARETWMLELPPDRAGEFGLGPRQFRARAKLDLGDRSVWTDTPSDKERRAFKPEQVEATSTSSLKSETEMIALAERDKAMQKWTEKHNKKKKRKESLVDMHQEKLKKKQMKEEEKGKPKERRPFDRNVDLQANRFDEAQKKAILRKAQLLDDRFSRGESKFL